MEGVTGGGKGGGSERAAITQMGESVLNEFGGQETNLGESRRRPVVCMLINSHDLFNGVAVSEGCEAWRGCREANTGLVPSAEMVRRFFLSSQAKKELACRWSERERQIIILGRNRKKK